MQGKKIKKRIGDNTQSKARSETTAKLINGLGLEMRHNRITTGIGIGKGNEVEEV